MDSPSQEIAKPITKMVTDSRGREIEVRKLKPLERLRMLEIIGAQNAENQPYLGYAMLAYSVNKIDEQVVPKIGSKLALEAVVARLDDEGLNAVGEAFKELYAGASGEEDQILKNE
jgi:hypothetical protein